MCEMTSAAPVQLRSGGISIRVGVGPPPRRRAGDPLSPARPRVQWASRPGLELVSDPQQRRRKHRGNSARVVTMNISGAVAE